MLVQLGRTRC